MMELTPYIIETLQFLFWGYGLSTLIFGIFAKISHQPKDKTMQYFTSANIIASCAGILLAITLFLELIQGYDTISDTDHTFFTYRQRPFILAILLTIATSMLTLSKKLRQNWFVSLFIALVLNICVMMENIFIIWTSIFRDYLPSSWGYYQDFRISSWLTALLCGVIYFTIVVAFMRLQKTRSKSH
ncbi:hypothetical protein [Chitinophaga niabensis]|uniref:hypothetical protein n=1 Tax=Chitinophaga niabensis TaxID=536979 RepID=UPI000941736F|nr:hypothetical protein [Chitinophaga niabensis]